MFTRSFGQILGVAFGMSLSSLAFARNPPALVAQQKAAENATETSGGYRDINSRFGAVPALAPEVMRAAGGYRDINSRFGADASGARTAASSAARRAE
jgi:hypothetical protein